MSEQIDQILELAAYETFVIGCFDVTIFATNVAFIQIF